MSELAKRQEYLVIDYNEMPDEIQDIFRQRESFHNDCFIKFHSEMEPFPYGQDKDKDWAETCTMAHIESYWQEQLKSNSKYCQAKTIEEFIDDYGLQAEVWLINSGINLKGIQKILIEICW